MPTFFQSKQGILLTFFVLSGMKLDVQMLKVAGIMGITYFFIRIVGKYIGSFVGSAVCSMDKPVRNYLGLALCPQAGVSIGLAALGQRLLPPDMAMPLTTIILSSAVLYGMVGPASPSSFQVRSKKTSMLCKFHQRRQTMYKRNKLWVIIVLAIALVLTLELCGLNWVFKSSDDTNMESSVLLMM